LDKFREIAKPYTAKYLGNHGTFSSSKDYSVESQKIQSVSHAPGYRNLSGSSSDIGGPFFSNKMKWSGLPARVSLQGDLVPSSSGWKSEGVLVPPFVEEQMRKGKYGTAASLAAISPTAESESSMLIKGTTAISRVAPTSPVWDGASALAELYGSGVVKAPLAGRDGNLPTSGKDLSKLNPGSEYLNLAFGYAPTASDILSMRDVARRSEKILAQLERDSGKLIRRSYEFPKTNPVPDSSGYQGTFPTFLGGGSPSAYEVGMGRMDLLTTTTRDQRFSGAFMYHLPPKGTWRRKIAELDHLYGLRPGIDTAWNAVPFSWLADYFGNMGDVLKNITAFAQDGLVLKYGYITSVTETTWDIKWSYPVRRDGDRNAWSNYTGSIQCSFRVMSRMPANPFGFGPTGVAITGRQKAILAALGVSLL